MGQNTADNIEQFTRSFDIDTGKVKAVVHDTTANEELASCNMSESHGWENIDCAAHKLQLSVNKGL